MKSKVFIGSSHKNKHIADMLCLALSRRNLQCDLWFDGFFEVGGITQLSLVQKAPNYDFAVFLTTADDQLMREKELIWVPRDNVIWELGLFTGILGSERCFIAYDG